MPPPPKLRGLTVEEHGDELVVVVQDRSYRVRGLHLNNSPSQLNPSYSRPGRFHPWAGKRLMREG